MLLSVIIASYRSQDYIKNFLKSYIEQSQTVKNSYGCELILVLDSPQKEELEIVEKHRKIIRDLKVIVNSSREGRISSNNAGLKIATGDYCVFLSSTDVLKFNFIDEVFKEIQRNKPEVIEFKTDFEGLLNWTPSLRYTTKKNVSIVENPQILTKILPIDFNKIWKRAFFVKNRVQFDINLNSRFNVLDAFLTIHQTKKYTTINKVLTTSVIGKDSQIPILSLTRSWDLILTHYEQKYNELYSEIYYAFLYYSSVFLMRFTFATKNSLLIKKQIHLISESRKKHEVIEKINPYLNSEENREGLRLKMLPIRYGKYHKILKGFK